MEILPIKEKVSSFPMKVTNKSS